MPAYNLLLLKTNQVIRYHKNNNVRYASSTSFLQYKQALVLNECEELYVTKQAPNHPTTSNSQHIVFTTKKYMQYLQIVPSLKQLRTMYW